LKKEHAKNQGEEASFEIHHKVRILRMLKGQQIYISLVYN